MRTAKVEPERIDNYIAKQAKQYKFVYVTIIVKGALRAR